MEGKDYAILTDIAGAEDHYGDMDFKVAGTREGITALQMDIKIPNVTTAIMKEALEQARRGRLFILDKMYEALPKANASISPYAPRIYTLHIPTDKIRDVIGPGGKVIRGIIEQTGVKIDVEDDGTVHVASADEASANKAIQIISDLTASAEVGKTYLGKVVRLVDFGAFVEIFPGTDGLLHISEIAENRIRDVRDELKEGDQILVKVLALEGNKIKLSRKAVLKEQREKLKHGKHEWRSSHAEPAATRSRTGALRESARWLPGRLPALSGQPPAWPRTYSTEEVDHALSAGSSRAERGFARVEHDSVHTHRGLVDRWAHSSPLAVITCAICFCDDGQLVGVRDTVELNPLAAFLSRKLESGAARMNVGVQDIEACSLQRSLRVSTQLHCDLQFGERYTVDPEFRVQWWPLSDLVRGLSAALKSVWSLEPARSRRPPPPATPAKR